MTDEANTPPVTEAEANVPVVPTPPPISAAHKETLLEHIKDFPAEFIHWVEKHL